MRYLKLLIIGAFIAILWHCKLYSDKVHEAQRNEARLEQMGYSKEWAHHKAWCEAGLIEKDSLYFAIEEN